MNLSNPKRMNIQRACQYHTKNRSQQPTNMTKTCILPKFTPPLHPPKKNLQRITKNPTKYKLENPSNPPRNIFWPSRWKNPMCCNSRLTGTAHGPEVEKFHPVSLPNPEGSLRTKKTRWVLGRTLQTLEIRSLLYVIVGVFVGGGNNDLLGTGDNVEVFRCKVVSCLHCEQLPWPCMDRKTFCLVRCICNAHSQYG